jgi:hypothetical protein
MAKEQGKIWTHHGDWELFMPVHACLGKMGSQHGVPAFQHFFFASSARQLATFLINILDAITSYFQAVT